MLNNEFKHFFPLNGLEHKEKIMNYLRAEAAKFGVLKHCSIIYRVVFPSVLSLEIKQNKIAWLWSCRETICSVGQSRCELLCEKEKSGKGQHFSAPASESVSMR